MARARYIICSESRLVDRTSGLVSHINALEQITVSLTPTVHPEATHAGKPAETKSIRFPNMVLVAVWMRDEQDDPDQQYHFETRLYRPGEATPTTVQQGEFAFGESMFFRIELVLQHGPPGEASTEVPMRPGVLRLESRIRRHGSEEWLSQDYPIPVTVVRAETS